MKTTFEKANFTANIASESDYVMLFAELGFQVSKVDICYTNGLSAYVTVNVNVIDENKMYADVFVYEGKATLKVRISDHPSNLERICNGVSNNKMSFVAFQNLIEKSIINQ